MRIQATSSFSSSTSPFPFYLISLLFTLALLIIAHTPTSQARPVFVFGPLTFPPISDRAPGAVYPDSNPFPNANVSNSTSTIPSAAGISDSPDSPNSLDSPGIPDSPDIPDGSGSPEISSPDSSSGLPCNGSPSLCSRPFSNITFVGSHNAPFVGGMIVHNQFVTPTEQLDMGVRFLQAQAHWREDHTNDRYDVDDDGDESEEDRNGDSGANDDGDGNEISDENDDENDDGHHNGVGIQMCHTNCFILDAGPLSDYLTEVREWVETHPREVVALLITNKDGVDVREFDWVFGETGLKNYVYTPWGSGIAAREDTGEWMEGVEARDSRVMEIEEWPTLGEMIDSGERVVVFMDFHANTAEVSYILDEFAYYFEGPYDTTEPDFPQCSIDRPPEMAAAAAAISKMSTLNVNETNAEATETTAAELQNGVDGRMYLVNHFLDIDLFGILIPNQLEMGTTNSFASIVGQTDLCVGSYERLPNVVLLDWINVGDAMLAQEFLNGVR